MESRFSLYMKGLVSGAIIQMLVIIFFEASKEGSPALPKTLWFGFSSLMGIIVSLKILGTRKEDREQK